MHRAIRLIVEEAAQPDRAGMEEAVGHEDEIGGDPRRRGEVR